jgi:DNA-binding MarR family transcriptional regulator
VLQLHGDFRKQLVALRVTPLQAGVMLFLHRHGDAKLKDAAAALHVQSPTVTHVINDLVRKRWVIRQRALQDDRSLCLRLSRQGTVLARKIAVCIRDISSEFVVTKET